MDYLSYLSDETPPAPGMIRTIGTSMYLPIQYIGRFIRIRIYPNYDLSDTWEKKKKKILIPVSYSVADQESESEVTDTSYLPDPDPNLNLVEWFKNKNQVTRIPGNR